MKIMRQNMLMTIFLIGVFNCAQRYNIRNMIQLPDAQYLHQIKKGSTVTYGTGNYRVQDDGKGFLHIIIKENGDRKKLGIKQLLFFEPGSFQDYVFNGWFEVYPTYQEYQSFASSELKCLEV